MGHPHLHHRRAALLRALLPRPLPQQRRVDQLGLDLPHLGRRPCHLRRRHRGLFDGVYLQPLQKVLVLGAGGLLCAGPVHRAGHRPLGQLHEPRGLRRPYGPSLADAPVGLVHDLCGCAPDVPLRKSLESDRFAAALLCRFPRPPLRRREHLLLLPLVRYRPLLDRRPADRQPVSVRLDDLRRAHPRVAGAVFGDGARERGGAHLPDQDQKSRRLEALCEDARAGSRRRSRGRGAAAVSDEPSALPEEDAAEAQPSADEPSKDSE